MKLTEEQARGVGVVTTPLHDEKGRGFSLSPINTQAADFLEWMMG